MAAKQYKLTDITKNTPNYKAPKAKYINPVLTEFYNYLFRTLPQRPNVYRRDEIPEQPVFTAKDLDAVKKKTANPAYVKKLRARHSQDLEGGGIINGQLQPERRSIQSTPVTDTAAASSKKWIEQKARERGEKVGNFTEDQAKIQAEIQANNQKLEELGAPNKEGGPSVLNRVLDVLSRGNYAAANSAREINRRASGKEDRNLSFGEFFGAAGKGFGRGFTGKDKTTFSGVFRDPSYQNAPDKGPWDLKVGKGKVAAALGLALDIGGDPTNFLGLGLVAKAGKAGKIGSVADKAAKAAKEVDRAVDSINKGKTVSRFELPPQIKDLLSGQKYASGQISQKAAKAEQAQVFKHLDDVAKQFERVEEARLRKGFIATNLAKYPSGTAAEPMARIRLITNLSKGPARKGAKEATDALRLNIIKNYEDITKTRIKKGMGFGTRNHKFTVVPAPIVDNIAKMIQSPDVVQKGVAAFERKFKASSHTFPELHNLKLAQVGAGMARVHFRGEFLKSTMKGINSDARGEVLEAIIRGDSVSGHTVKIMQPDGSEIAQDAAEMLGGRLDAIQNVIRGHMGEPPISAKELVDSLPPGFAGQIVEAKGKGINVRQTLKNWSENHGIRDAAKAQWLFESAYERAAAKQAMMHSMAESFGVAKNTLAGGDKFVADLVSRRSWRTVDARKTYGYLNDVKFDPEVARGVEKILELINDERNWNKWMFKLNRFNGPIKFLYTLPNPGYHIRNSLGDIFINQLDNVSPQSYFESIRVLAKRGQKYEGASPLIMSQGDILANARSISSKKPLFKNTKKLRAPDGKIYPHVTEAEIYAGMNKYGIRQNYAMSEFGNLGEGFSLQHNPMVAKVVSASELREDYFRLAHFIQLVKDNPDKVKTLDEVMQSAATRIRKTHFDYTDFTKFEKQTMSNIIPFYKWTRKALPLMAEIMFTQPGKAIVPSKIQNSLSDMMGEDVTGNDPLPQSGAIIPKWLIDAGYDPMGNLPGRDHQLFGKIPDPFTDVVGGTIQGLGTSAEDASTTPLGRAQGPVDVLGAMTTPALKLPVELLANRQFFTGGPLVRRDIGQENAQSTGGQYAKYAGSQVPFVRQIMAATGSRDNLGPMVSQFGGMYSQELTPQMQTSELLRQRELSRRKLRRRKRDLEKLEE